MVSPERKVDLTGPSGHLLGVKNLLKKDLLTWHRENMMLLGQAQNWSLWAFGIIVNSREEGCLFV